MIMFSVPQGSIYAYGFIYCNSENDCRHEIGHRMDHELGQVSKSDNFGLAIATHLYMQSKYFELDTITDVIYGTGGIFFYSDEYQPFGKRYGSYPQQELYANIYAKVNGDISKLPVILQPFYSTDKFYINLYNCLMENEIKYCNKSLYIEGNHG
jgi:hypothetical protein